MEVESTRRQSANPKSESLDISRDKLENDAGNSSKGLKIFNMLKRYQYFITYNYSFNVVFFQRRKFFQEIHCLVIYFFKGLFSILHSHSIKPSFQIISFMLHVRRNTTGWNAQIISLDIVVCLHIRNLPPQKTTSARKAVKSTNLGPRITRTYAN